MPETNREFNQGQPIVGMKNTVTFTAPEVMIPLQVRRARLDERLRRRRRPSRTSRSPAAAGTFELKTIPPGTYTIEAWHEKLGRQTQTVTLGEKDSKEITFTFKVRSGPDGLAPPLRQARRRLHGAADRRGRHGDEHRLGTLGPRLADDVRVEHVHVSGEQVGRRASATSTATG